MFQILLALCDMQFSYNYFVYLKIPKLSTLAVKESFSVLKSLLRKQGNPKN